MTRICLRRELDTFFDGNEMRKLGCLPTDPVMLAEFKQLREFVDIIPRDKWEPRDNRHLVRRIFDQNGIGSCASEATVQAVESCRALAGLDNVFLSPGNLYGRVNGGSDHGSTLGMNLKEITTRGVCTEALVPHIDWQNWNAPGWLEEAAKYRALELYAADNGDFDACISAILCGYTAVFGIMVGKNFYPDAEGWVPDYVSGTGGHGLIGIGVGYRNGVWGVQTANSWGSNWGWGGFLYLPESYFKTYSEDAFCLRAVVDPEDDAD